MRQSGGTSQYSDIAIEVFGVVGEIYIVIYSVIGREKKEKIKHKRGVSSRQDKESTSGVKRYNNHQCELRNNEEAGGWLEQE